MNTNDVSRMSARAAIFDACIAEMSAQKQWEYLKLAEWVSENILARGAGLSSAKELIVQRLRFEDKNPKLFIGE